MIDLGSALAVGLSGFLAGMAYATKGHTTTLRLWAAAGVIIVGSRGYVLAPLNASDPAGFNPDPVRAPLPDNAVPISERRGDAT